MKRFYKQIMLTVMAMVMTVSPASAQQEDFDPGLIYFMHSNETVTPYDEGQEWTLSFECEDSLGVQYNNPVGISLIGGSYQDTLSFVMQDLDSLLLFQPKPVVEDGVFEITAEYLPYIVEVDSTNTIITFSSDIPSALPLPVVGQKVVCTLEEYPLPALFVGVVSEIVDNGGNKEFYFYGEWEKYSDFFKQIIYSSHAFSQDEAAEKVPERKLRRRQVRTGDAVTYGDLSWGLLDLNFPAIKYSYSNDDFSFLPPNVGFSAELDLSSGNLGVDVELLIYVDKKWVQNEGFFDVITADDWNITARMGFNFHVGLSCALELKDVSIPLWPIVPGKAITVGPMGGKFELGLYLIPSAKLNFTGLNFNVNTIGALEIGSSTRRNYKKSIGCSWVTFDLTGEVRVAFLLAMKLKTGASSSSARIREENEDSGSDEFAVVANEPHKARSGLNADIDIDCGFNIFKADAKVSLGGINDGYDNSSPSGLVHNLAMKADGFKAEVHFGNLYAKAKADVSLKITSGWSRNFVNWNTNKDLFTIYSFKTKYLPDYTKEMMPLAGTSLMGNAYRDYRYKIDLCSFNVMPWQAYYWAWDIQKGTFDVETPHEVFSESHFRLFSNVGETSKPFSLRKGTAYLNCPVFSHPLSTVYMMDEVPTEVFRVPYDVSTSKPEYGFMMVGKGRIDPQAVLDKEDHTFAVGFQYMEDDGKGSKDFSNARYFVAPFGEQVSAEFPLLEPETPYVYRTFLTVSDPKPGAQAFYGEPVSFVSGPDFDTPIMKDITTYAYVDATVKAELSDVLIDQMKFNPSNYQLGFEYAVYDNKKSDDKQEWKTSDIYTPESLKFNDNIFSHHLVGLEPNTEYAVRAFVITDFYSNAKPHYSKPKRVKTLDCQKLELKVDSYSYFTADVTVGINAGLRQWIGTGRHQIESKLRYGRTKDPDADYDEVDITDMTKEEYPIKLEHLTSNEDYVAYPVLYVDGEKIKGESQHFRTKDALTPTLHKATDVSYFSATISCSVVKELVNELKALGKEYYVVFYYSSSESAVKDRTGHASPHYTLNKQEYSYDIEGRKSNQTNYYTAYICEKGSDEVIGKAEPEKFKTKNLFAPYAVNARMTDEGLNFEVEMHELAVPQILEGNTNVDMLIYYSTTKESLDKGEFRNEVAMTWREYKNSLGETCYHFSETIPDLDLAHEYYYRAVSIVDGEKSPLDGGGTVSTASITVNTGETSESTYDMEELTASLQGSLTSDFPEHLRIYDTHLHCSFAYGTDEQQIEDLPNFMFDMSGEDATLYEESAVLNKSDLTFEAKNFFVPTGDEESIDYYFRASLTLDNGERFWGEMKSFTAYYYSGGSIVWIGRRTRNARGEWVREPLPAHVRELLSRGRN